MGGWEGGREMYWRREAEKRRLRHLPLLLRLLLSWRGRGKGAMRGLEAWEGGKGGVGSVITQH